MIEVDGGQHYTPEGIAYDAQRTAFLEGLGLRVMRFSNVDVQNNFVGVSERIRAVLLGGES